MIASASVLYDEFDRPMKANGKPRHELAEAFAKVQSEARQKRRGIDARYDAATPSLEYDKYWAQADDLDADSADSPRIRQRLVRNSRYENANNGYYSGIGKTYADDLIGRGPNLRMTTGSEGFNRVVELAWQTWTKEVKFRRKLWTMAHAKDQDGEGIGIVRKNSGLKNPVKLDIQTIETEQCASPFLQYGDKNRVDGVWFNQFGTPTFYDILPRHPGSNVQPVPFTITPEKVPARFVMFWFKEVRPGQHRGIPARASTLNIGASARRWREAVVGAAENIADFSLFIKTQLDPDQVDAVPPMSTEAIQKRMMVALPMGYDAFQPKAEQPTANHEEFSKSLVNEQARPNSMPLNKAMCNSSDYNYASGRLDFQTYYAALDVDRGECDDLVMEPLFDVWFEMAVVVYGWLGGNPDALSDGAKAHIWDWPKHAVVDIATETAANDKKLKNGSSSLTQVASEQGQDYEDDLLTASVSNGITVDEQRTINLLVNLPQHISPIVATMLGLQPVTEPQPPATPAPQPAGAA